MQAVVPIGTGEEEKMSESARGNPGKGLIVGVLLLVLAGILLFRAYSEKGEGDLPETEGRSAEVDVRGDAVAWQVDLPVQPLLSQADVSSVRKKTDRVRVAYMPPASEYNFYRTVGQGIQSLARELDIEYEQAAPLIDNPYQQRDMLKNIVEGDHADILIFGTHNPPLVAPLVARAVDAGMVVIIVNSDVPDFDTPVHAVVGYAQRNGTRALGAYLSEAFEGEHLKVGILEGAAGYHSDERVGGFVDGIAANPNAEIVARVEGGWNVTGGFTAAMGMLAEHPEIRVLFAANDYAIMGAASAVGALGKEGILFLGNDGDIAALERIARGELHATVNTMPFDMGKVALQVGLAILDGGFEGGFVETPTSVAHEGNIGEFHEAEAMATLDALQGEKILVLSEEFKGLSEPGGKGLYFEILKAIYAPHGIELEFGIYPYVRAVRMIQRKDLGNILLGAYPGVTEGVYFPQWHYDIDIASVLFKGERIEWVEGGSALQGRRVGLIRFYNLDRFLPADVVVEEQSIRDGAIHMVMSDRLDFFLDKKSETARVLTQLELDPAAEGLVIQDLFTIRQYIGFTEDARGRKLADLFDDALPKMIADGSLKALFEKWGFEYQF